jgi:RimJ/RimL family protein N-acetyltransferase
VVTARLSGEPLSEEHLDDLAALLLDDRVWPTLWPHPTRPTREDIARQLGHMSAHWRRHGFGLWLLRDRATGVVVGRGGLEFTRATGTDEVELAWMIAPGRWGEGLATELAHHSVKRAFADLHLDHVIALTLPGNRASRRVMEKAGLRHVGDIEHAGLAHVLYRRLRNDGV